MKKVETMVVGTGSDGDEEDEVLPSESGFGLVMRNGTDNPVPGGWNWTGS